jgi:hypothetical protein
MRKRPNTYDASRRIVQKETQPCMPLRTGKITTNTISRLTFTWKRAILIEIQSVGAHLASYLLGTGGEAVEA